MRRIVAVLALFFLAGCRYHPDTVPLAGDHEAWHQMVGEWRGTFTGRETGRVGTITFVIKSSADSAWGDVMMATRGVPEPFLPIDPRDAHIHHVMDVQALSVGFVRLADGQIRGSLEPFRSPDCRCTARTTFLGRVSGNTIKGGYITVMETGVETHGSWSVKRQ